MAVLSLVCIRTNDPNAKLMCRWVQSWKYNKMVDSNIILYSKLNLSDKYKNAKFLTSTGKKTTIGMFCLNVILTISYLRAQTIETSSLPTDSSRPLFKQIETFSILTV